MEYKNANEKKPATLVIMAAGIGSRFGGGIKQLEPVGPNGEIIMDYSIYDAATAGFNKVVFVIRRDLEKDFKEIIGNRIEKTIEVAYAYQELGDIPEAYQERFKERSKPWGTGQAVLACQNIVKEPFVVINADDYYGKDAYKKAYAYLTEEKGENQVDMAEIAMVSFVLKNTLSDHGTVTRGVCQVGEGGYLDSIVETSNIAKLIRVNPDASPCSTCPSNCATKPHAEQEIGVGILGENDEVIQLLDLETPVSMNIFCVFPDFFAVLEKGFIKFLESLQEGDLKAEYLLPSVIGQLLEEKKLAVRVLNSKDQWFGVTYKEDKEVVVQAVKALIEKGYYEKI